MSQNFYQRKYEIAAKLVSLLSQAENLADQLYDLERNADCPDLLELEQIVGPIEEVHRMASYYKDAIEGPARAERGR